MKLLRKLLAAFRKPERNYESRDDWEPMPLHHHLDPITDVMMEDLIANHKTMPPAQVVESAFAVMDRCDDELLALVKATAERRRQGNPLHHHP
jgi:hypothetical protein